MSRRPPKISEGAKVGDAGAQTWVSGEAVDRGGIAGYLHLIRAADDPERSPRKKVNDPARDTMALWRKRLKKDAPETWADRVEEHLADGVPRTFNRICVELIDKTADVVHGTPLDDAIWLLVREGRAEHTLDVPILFRLKPIAEIGDGK